MIYNLVEIAYNKLIGVTSFSNREAAYEAYGNLLKKYEIGHVLVADGYFKGAVVELAVVHNELV